MHDEWESWVSKPPSSDKISELCMGNIQFFLIILNLNKTIIVFSCKYQSSGNWADDFVGDSQATNRGINYINRSNFSEPNEVSTKYLSSDALWQSSGKPLT